MGGRDKLTKAEALSLDHHSAIANFVQYIRSGIRRAHESKCTLTASKHENRQGLVAIFTGQA